MSGASIDSRLSVQDFEQISLDLELAWSDETPVSTSTLEGVRELLGAINARGRYERDLTTGVALQQILDRWSNLLKDPTERKLLLLDDEVFHLSPPDARFRDTSMLRTWRDASVMDALRHGEPLTGIVLTDRALGQLGTAGRPGRFVDCRFDGVDGANVSFVPGSSFIRCRFEGGTFAAAELAGTTFADCALEGTLFEEANLRDVVITDSLLTGVGFKGADLDRAFLGRSLLTAVEMDARTSLRGATICAGSTLRDLHWQEVQLSETSFSESRFREVEFLRCDLVGARFSGVDARGLVLHEVNGNGCLFIDTPLAGISIGGGSWAASVFKECPETRHAAGWESLEAIEQQEEEAWVIRGPRPAKRLKPGEPPRSEFSELGAPELMTWEDDWVLETIATGRAVVGIEIKQEPDASSRKAAVRLFSQSAARFVDCRFLTADFRGVEFAPGTAFVSCRFEKGALFDGAHLDELSFSDCYLAGASLKNVSAARVMITNSVLDACDISGGNFDDATIGRSVLRGVQGNRQTTFRRSAFSGRTALRDLNLRGSLFTGATFADSLIVGSSFDDCTFERARFLAMTWSNTDFIRSDLSHAYFVDNDLSDVAFHHSDLRGVVLRNCQGATELEAEELASSGSGMVLRYILT